MNEKRKRNVLRRVRRLVGFAASIVGLCVIVGSVFYFTRRHMLPDAALTTLELNVSERILKEALAGSSEISVKSILPVASGQVCLVTDGMAPRDLVELAGEVRTWLEMSSRWYTNSDRGALVLVSDDQSINSTRLSPEFKLYVSARNCVPSDKARLRISKTTERSGSPKVELTLID